MICCPICQPPGFGCKIKCLGPSIKVKILRVENTGKVLEMIQCIYELVIK